jgi:hypothetical protein
MGSFILFILTSHIYTATRSAAIQVRREIIIVVLVNLHACGTMHIGMTHDYRYSGAYIPVSATERNIYLTLTIIIYVVVLIIYIPHRAGVVIDHAALYRRIVVVMDDTHLVAAMAIVVMHMLVVMTMFVMVMTTPMTLCIYAYTGTSQQHHRCCA